MVNPVAHGVHEAVRRARLARGGPPRPDPGSPLGAWTMFLVTTASLSWITAALVGGPPALDDDSVVGALFTASLYYAAVMGWQPLVAARLVRWRFEPAARAGAARPGRRADIALAVALAGGLVAVAMVIAKLAGEPVVVATSDEAGAEIALRAVGAFVVLCAQAFGEEYGWRGYPLTCAIERFGVRGGLAIHGVAWGVWYAPMFLVSSGAPSSSAEAAGAFVVTCLLLGCVLGWLRLRSGSIVPSAVANAVLTISAGLPVLLQVGSIGARDAVYRWPGWPVIAIVAIVLLTWRYRDVEGRAR